MTGSLRFVSLGGLGEIGKNMMVVEDGETMLVIDAGLMFPDAQLSGIDFVIPDFSYVLENREKVAGIILTHGHEDHIGALPYLLREIDAPVFGSRLTLGFARNRMEEHPPPHPVEYREIEPRQILSFGNMTVEFFRVCHSVAGGFGVAFHTPAGYIVHTGDFKFDFGPGIEHSFDLYTLAEFGEKGVLLLMSDSTNAENRGYTPSEKELKGALFETIYRAEGRVLVSTFSSNIHRIQHVFDVCREVGRKICILGRSMVKNIDLARELGYLRFNRSMIVPADRVMSVERRKIVILTTGTQGEPMSALSQIASDRHKNFDIERGDTVVLSASIIPGNEKTVSRVVNGLFERGATVYYEGFEALHVSGHASREELKLMMALTRPRYFIPIHGEFRHLFHHANLAREYGVPDDRIFICVDGDVIEVDGDTVSLGERVRAGRWFIDGRAVVPIDTALLMDRCRLSEDGLIIAVLTRSDGEISEPHLYTRGFVHPGDRVLERARTVLAEAVRDCARREGGDEGAICDEVKETLTRFFAREGFRPPVVLPIVIDLKNEN
jgi:ribonuclease J